MAGVINSEDAGVVSAADFEAVDAAVRGYQPRSLFGVAVDCSDQIKSQITDRPGVRENYDSFSFVDLQDFFQCGCSASEQMPIAFTVRDFVIYVPIYECIVILRILLL